MKKDSHLYYQVDFGFHTTEGHVGFACHPARSTDPGAPGSAWVATLPEDQGQDSHLKRYQGELDRRTISCRNSVRSMDSCYRCRFSYISS